LEQILISDAEVKQPSSIKPKLTMKFLHILIKEIQLENESLTQRVHELEQQIADKYQARSEIATAEEQLPAQEEIQMQAIQMQETQLHGIQVSRSERHASTRKFFFWFQ
jgi:hypothetical protein